MQLLRGFLAEKRLSKPRGIGRQALAGGGEHPNGFRRILLEQVEYVALVQLGEMACLSAPAGNVPQKEDDVIIDATVADVACPDLVGLEADGIGGTALLENRYPRW